MARPISPNRIYAELKRLGFRRFIRGYGQNPHVYQKAYPERGRLCLNVQIWPDGLNRVSFDYAGHHWVTPSEFSTAAELQIAVEWQLTQAPKSEAEYEVEAERLRSQYRSTYITKETN